MFSPQISSKIIIMKTGLLSVDISQIITIPASSNYMQGLIYAANTCVQSSFYYLWLGYGHYVISS